MKRVKLGRTNIEVSALAMGSDLIGSRIDRETSFRLFDFFSENGGTLIDTANMYSCWLPGCKGGESETTIGLWMKERGNRDQMVVSSKVGFDFPGCAGGLSAAEIERECEKSLKRLQTDTIDLYYAHRDDRDTPLEETMEALDRLIKAGKVRVAGASNLARGASQKPTRSAGSISGVDIPWWSRYIPTCVLATALISDRRSSSVKI